MSRIIGSPIEAVGEVILGMVLENIQQTRHSDERSTARRNPLWQGKPRRFLSLRWMPAPNDIKFVIVKKVRVFRQGFGQEIKLNMSIFFAC